MPDLQILSREGSQVRYRVTYEDGTRSTTTRDCSAEIAEARERKVSLASVLAKQVKVPGVEPIEAKVVIKPPPAPENPEGEEVTAERPVEYVLPEHDHEGISELATEFRAADETLAKGMLHLQERVSATEARTWAEAEHPHRALEEALVFANETTTRLSLQVAKQHEEALNISQKQAEADAFAGQVKAAIEQLREVVARPVEKPVAIPDRELRADLDSVVRELNLRLEAINRGNAQTQAVIATQDARIEKLQGRLATAIADLEQAQHDVARALQENAALRGEVSDLRELIVGLNKRLPAMETKLARLPDSLPDKVAAQDHDHEMPAHSHEEKPHAHPELAHDHERYSPKIHGHLIEEHSHPEIVGLFTPEQMRTAGKRQGAHIHQWDRLESDGKGWKCGICGIPRNEVTSG